METCSGLEGEERSACFAYFGCDGARVEHYFGAVEALEMALLEEEEEDEDEYVEEAPFNWGHICFH
jgi:hypothetical protein